MNSVYFPVHVAVLLRRIVNVISTLSISNQYLLLKQSRAEEAAAAAERGDRALQFTGFKDGAGNTFDGLRAVEWPWWTCRDRWDWPRLVILEGAANAAKSARLHDGTVKTSGIPFPWFGRRWAWPSPRSMSTETETERSPSHDDPPPPPQHSRPRRPPTSPPRPTPPEFELDRTSLDIIHQLLTNPALYDPLRTPRYPIVLCHGLYGFDVRGPSSFPSLRMHYWSNVLSILRDKVGAEVIVTSVPGTGSVASRSESMDRQLQGKARGRGINFLAHSMGGLDCRHLISHIKPTEYAPLSLTTVSTPHRGSPFMDWCAENIGIGKLRQREELAKSRSPDSPAPPFTAAPPPPPPSASESQTGNTNTKSKPETPFSLSLSSLPSSFTTLLLSILDSPAYANLTTAYLNNVFNPATPNDPHVKYFSVAGRMPGVSVWHPFWLPKLVLDGVEEKERGKMRAVWEGERESGGEFRWGAEKERTPLWASENEWGNDGLVTVQSAKWGEFLGIMEGCDHWEMRGARGIELGVDLPGIGIGGGGGAGSGEGWGLKDWGRFVGAWRKEEKIQRDAAVAAEKEAGVQPSQTGPQDRELERERQRERDDAVVKSSTDKLSAVFDWLVDQVPAPPALGAKGKAMANAEVRTRGESATAASGVSEMKKHMDKEGKGRKKNELASKMDLERFYVALSRKLYDEGL